MATGLLIICTGRGTKQIDDFVAMEKAYSGTLRLGQATLSYDAMSDIEEELPWEHITGEQLIVPPVSRCTALSIPKALQVRSMVSSDLINPTFKPIVEGFKSFACMHVRSNQIHIPCLSVLQKWAANWQ